MFLFMSEHWGTCPVCDGKGEDFFYNPWLKVKALEECGSCGGTGFWSGAFPPSPEYLYYLDARKINGAK